MASRFSLDSRLSDFTHYFFLYQNIWLYRKTEVNFSNFANDKQIAGQLFLAGILTRYTLIASKLLY